MANYIPNNIFMKSCPSLTDMLSVPHDFLRGGISYKMSYELELNWHLDFIPMQNIAFIRNLENSSKIYRLVTFCPSLTYKMSVPHMKIRPPYESLGSNQSQISTLFVEIEHYMSMKTINGWNMYKSFNKTIEGVNIGASC